MEKLANLTLSEKEMPTSSAKEFIAKNASDLEYPGPGTYILENRYHKSVRSFNRAALGTNLMEIIELEIDTELANPTVTGQKLAGLIEKNSEMFAELEYVARGTKPNDVLNGHLKLICQILRCHDALWNSWPTTLLNNWLLVIEFHKTTPLYHLGLIAATLYMNPRIFCAIVLRDETMKYVCQFFVDLCHEAGIHIMPLIYSADTEWTFEEDCVLKVLPDMGCTGVITERSDLDSAIDVFIRSSETAPWRLKQVYVQESLFESFKLALKARADWVGSDHILIGNKKFLVENLSPLHGIPTQAYRTTKELLSLIDTPFLSVWAANSAESNEIALKASSTIVWVNEYGTFDGPPRTALSVYGSSFSKLQGVFTAEYKNLNDNLGPWSETEIEERLRIVIGDLEAVNDDVCKELLPKLEEWRSDDVVQVTDKTVCLGIQIPRGIVFSRWMVDTKQQYRVLKSLINGNVVALVTYDVPTINKLTDQGLPIVEQRQVVFKDETIPVSYPLILEKFKVIRTNYGTIFAN